MGEHDQLFKTAFRNPVHAAGELASVLPKEVLDAIDLTSLTLVPGDTVSSQLDERFADALFKADFKTAGPGFIWLLLEHQSAPDRWMPLRVLEQLTRLWIAWRKDNPEAKLLPPFLCVVVHHGEGGWSARTRLHDLVAGLQEAPALRRYVPDFELIVDDLVFQSDELLLKRPLGTLPKVVLWALRDARHDERLLQTLRTWGRPLEELNVEAPEDVTTVLRYILGVAGEESLKTIKRRLTEAAPATEEKMQTIAQALESRGRAAGKEEGKAEDVLAVLEVRGLRVTDEQRDFILTCKDVAQLDRWLRQAVTATDAAALFVH